MGLLGYSRREARFLTADELIGQFEAYCEMHRIETEERGLDEE